MRRLLVVVGSCFALSSCAPTPPPPSAPHAPPPVAPASSAGAGASPVGTAPGVPMLAGAPPPLADGVSFTLYKFLARVGSEHDTYVALPGGGTEAKAAFAYQDRRRTMPIGAVYDFAADGALERYAAWGLTSRFTSIDDHVEALDGGFTVWRTTTPRARVSPAGPAVAASGYAPMLGQELLFRAWNEHKRPPRMAMLPDGEVSIETRGEETYDRPSGKVTLEHLAASGLVWGREDAWLDEKGALAAVVTRDAEFDHFEAAREGFGSLLPQLTKTAGADGVAWLATAAAGAERTASGLQAFAGATLIDGTGRPPVKDAVVLTDGDRIVAAGPRAKVAIPPGATVVDVSGKSIIPGLWDMHAHVEQVEQGLVYLAAGVTTVRDMGNILDFITGIRDAIDSGKGLGPRILVEGIVDGSGPAALGTVRITKKEDIAPTLDRLKKAGCLDVKIYSSIDPALVRPIVQYAHAHGMRAVGHVPNGMTAQQAVDAGYDSISHIHYIFEAGLPEKAFDGLGPEKSLDRMAAIDLASPPMARLIASLASHHVVVDDTLALVEQVEHTEADNEKREPGIATLPRELAATLGGVSPDLAERSDAVFRRYLDLTSELHKRGIALVAGTDITVPGHSLHRELELYVQAGFTPMEALQAATSIPAHFMRAEKQLGTIEAGKRADFVVLNGDPLADISNVRKTSLVVARGRAYDSPALWKLAGFRPR